MSCNADQINDILRICYTEICLFGTEHLKMLILGIKGHLWSSSTVKSRRMTVNVECNVKYSSTISGIYQTLYMYINFFLQQFCFYYVFWKTVAKIFPFSLFREGISNAMCSSLTLLFA